MLELLCYSMLFVRSGEKWKQLRSLHGKQHAPSNVYGYIPGFNRATDRFLQNIVKAQDENGYVHDVKNLITYWSFEGKELTIFVSNLSVYYSWRLLHSWSRYRCNDRS